jgi:hypothetical protein
MARRRRRGLVVLGGLAGLALAARSRSAFHVRVERMKNRAGDPVAPFLDAPCHRGEAVSIGDADHEAEVVS